MRVLLLTDADAFAGTERHILDLAQACRDGGYADTTIGCPPNTPLAERAQAMGIPFLEVPRAVKPARQILRRSIRSGGFDIIHAHNGRSSMIAAMAGAGKQCVLGSTLHFISMARERRGGIKGLVSDKMHAWLSGRTGFWIAISDVVSEASAKRDPKHHDRVTRVHNGIIKPIVNNDRAITRQKMGITEDQTLLLTVNRLESEKGTGALIGVAKQLEANGITGWRWLVAGSGSLEQSLRNEVEEVWPEGDAPIEFLGRRDDIPDLMEACDGFVHPAPAEPFGLVLTEAMALGRAVIASTGGAAPEIVIDGETGLLFAASETQDLFNKVRQLLSKTEIERKEWGLAARSRFEQYFTADRMARETATVYQQAFQANRRS